MPAGPARSRQGKGRPTIRGSGHGLWAPDRHVRDHQAVAEAALRTVGHEPVGRREGLDQDGLLAPFDELDEALDAEHVVEVDQQFVVGVGQRHLARQAPALAPVLDGPEAGGAHFFAERP